MPTFSELLNEYVARIGIGDSELARRIGVSRLTLVRWKEGVTGRPRHREDVVRCAEVLRLTPEERDGLLLSAGFSPESVPGPAVSSQPASAPPPEAAGTALRPLWRRSRFQAAVAVVLAAALVTGLAVVTLSEGPEYPAAVEGESLIVMAPFVNYTGGQQGFNIHGRLKEEIDREVLAAGLAGVRTVEWPEEIDGEEAAVVAGRRSGATIVIWGEYDSGRVMAVFTIPASRSEEYDQQVVSLALSPSELSATINVGLTEEVRYVALLTLGQLYLEQESFDLAKTVLIRAMDHPPSEPDALAALRFWLARAYQGGELKDLDEAIWLFTQVLAVQPRSVDTYNSRALAYLNRNRAGDVDLALADLTRAMSIDPERAATYLNRAVAHMEGGGGDSDLDRAIADLTEAIDIRSDYAVAYVNRAGAYMKRSGSGDLNLAFDDLERALEIVPDLAVAYLNRGNAYLYRGEEGDLDLAAKEFSRAIELAPDSPQAYFNRGLVYSALEEWDRSSDDLRRARELRPYDPVFNSTLCWQLGVRGEPEEALPFCDVAVEVDPGGKARDSRGLVYGMIGRTDEAIADLEGFLTWVDTSGEACRRHYRSSRLAWIEALEAGSDPFDTETLRGLNLRPVLPNDDPC